MFQAETESAHCPEWYRWTGESVPYHEDTGWLHQADGWKFCQMGLCVLLTFSITPLWNWPCGVFLSWQTWDLTWLYDTKFIAKLKISDRHFSYPKKIIDTYRNESHANPKITPRLRTFAIHWRLWLHLLVISYIIYRTMIPMCILFLSWQTWSECKGDLYGNW